MTREAADPSAFNDEEISVHMVRSERIRMAFSSLRDNALRSGLTAVIIALGIMAIVGIMTSIEAIRGSLLGNFSDLGASAFTIRNDRPEFGAPSALPAVTDGQAERFIEEFAVPARTGRSLEVSTQSVVSAREAETNPTVRVLATDLGYLSIYGRSVAAGRSFSPAEVADGARVALLGPDVLRALDLPTDSALGRLVQVDGKSFRVTGVLAAKGSSSGSPDNMVVVPLATALRDLPLSGRSIDIAVEPLRTDAVDATVAEAVGLFRTIRGLGPGEANDFEIEKSDKLYKELMGQLRYIRLGTLVIGLLTLLSAGIGLMNILLVAVGERTREIGVVKSMGATRADIRWQFIWESLLICTIGGGIGVVLGIAAGNGVGLLLDSGFILPWAWLGLGIGFSLAVGLAAGIYPALKAGDLHPVEALRHA